MKNEIITYSNKILTSNVRIVLTAILIFFCTIAITNLINDISYFGHYGTIWHTLFESINIMFSIMIFLATFYAFNYTRRYRTIILTMIFLSASILNILHMSSYTEIKNNRLDYYMSQAFYYISSIIKSLGLLIFALVRINAVTKIKRYVFIIPTLVFVILIVFSIFFFYFNNPEALLNFLEPFFHSSEGNMVFLNVITLRWFIVIGYLIAGMILVKEYLLTNEPYVKFMIASITVSIFSHLTFLAFPGVEHYLNYHALIFRIIAAYLLFNAIFISYVQKPYKELVSINGKIEEHTKELEGLIYERTQELNIINEKLLQDLEIAKCIQKTILPPKYFLQEGIESYIEYKPCQNLGGDFCRVFSLGKDNIGIYIGDVSGHGVPAAMLTMYLNQTMVSIIQKEEQKRKDILSPAQTLKIIYNAYNDSNFEEDMYVVLFYAIYNIPEKKLTYSSAGMNTIPILFNTKGETQYLKISGFPISRFTEIIPCEFEDKSIDLGAGSRILLYTDGLVDLKDKEGSRYGRERLERIIRMDSKRQLKEIGQSILKDLGSFSEGKDFDDDITFVIMDIKK